MRQDEFVLKIERVQDLPQHVRDEIDSMGVGGTLSITAWEPGEGFMIDQEITYMYPVLKNELEFDEVCEGDMLYYGDLSSEQLTERLIELGFMVAGNDNIEGADILDPVNDEDEEEVPLPPVQSTLQELNYEMQQCIEREDYKRCAEIRDEIKERFN